MEPPPCSRPLAQAERLLRRLSRAAPEVKAFELEEITIPELQEGMKSGKYTARSLVEKYHARIEEVDTPRKDKRGPAMNAIIELNPDALSIADALDQERKAKGPRGPLHGVPVLIKDNIDTADKMMTTAGSLALVGSKPPKDSFRGAEAARGGRGDSGQDQSQRVGEHSVQPLDQRMERARRANEESLCTGSQCLRIEFWLQVRAFRRTLRWWALGLRRMDRSSVRHRQMGSRESNPRWDWSAASASFRFPTARMGRDQCAARCAMRRFCSGALTGVDPEDAATAASAGKSQTDYAQYCDPNGLKGARIGVARKYFGFSDAVDGLMEQSLGVLKQRGATLVDPADIETLGKFDESEFLGFLYELKADLNAYLARLGPGAPVRTLAGYYRVQ